MKSGETGSTARGLEPQFMNGPTSPCLLTFLGSQEPEPKFVPSESCHPLPVSGTWVQVPKESTHPKLQVAGGV